MRSILIILVLASCAKKKIDETQPARPAIALDEEDMEEFPEAGNIDK